MHILVEPLPDSLTFRNFTALINLQEEVHGQEVTCLPSEDSILLSGRMWRTRRSCVKRDAFFLCHVLAK